MSVAQYVACEVLAAMGRKRASRRHIAEIIGLSQTQTNKRLRGEIEFRISELERIASALGVPVNQFLPPRATP